MSHDTDKLVSQESATLSKELLKILKSAESDVNIVSPYLTPTDKVMETFRHLIQEKKVRVRVITNSLKSTDNLFAQAGYRYLKDKMIKMGGISGSKKAQLKALEIIMPLIMNQL